MSDMSTNARGCATAALAIALGLSGLCTARAETYQMRAKAGEQIRLDAYASNDGRESGCASTPGTIRLLVPPRGGRTSQSMVRSVLKNSLDGNRGDDCIRAVKNAAALYYAARPGFSGVDKVVTEVRFANGTYHEFTYLVTVDPGVERPAPDPAPVARPREDFRPTPTPTERAAVAPAARPTSASDFLSRATGDRRQSAPPLVAPALPTVAAQEPVTPSAQQITTAQPEAPKAALPSAPPPPTEMAPPPAPRQQRTFEPRL